MAKEKKNVVIDGYTYYNVDVSNYNGSYTLRSSGIAQVVRQYIKRKYGDIKVWVRTREFSGGSAVDIYLWQVPDMWYQDIDSFADKFGKYNADPYSDYWKGKDASVKLEDGTSISNFSPYMHVHNSPPWDAKEKDMTPPTYSEKQTKTTKKTFSRKSPKRTNDLEGFELIQDCGNGWKIYRGQPKTYNLYVLIKDESVPPNREQWAEIKGDLLDVGFQWKSMNQRFERWSLPLVPMYEIERTCTIMQRYFPTSEPTTSEEPMPTPQHENEEADVAKFISDLQVLLNVLEDETEKQELEQFISDLKLSFEI